MIPQPDLSQLVATMGQARVAVVGDVMLDRYVNGVVDRISPEAPVPVLRIEGSESMLGGAGNVVRNLVGLGSRVYFASVIGDDPAGAEVRRLVLSCPGVFEFLIEVPARRTTIKTRFISAGQQVLRADEETLAPLPANVREQLFEAGRRNLGGSDALLLSDYGKGVLTDGLAEALIQSADGNGLPIVVDPKGEHYSRYAGATVVAPNRAELAKALGGSYRPGEEPEAARQLMSACGLQAVLVTLGRDGMLLVSADDSPVFLKAEAREVFDVSGAGDTVVATLAAALAAGAPLQQAAALANTAAGIVVGKVGTAPVRSADLAHALRHQDLTAGEAKIVAVETAVDLVAAWHRRDLKVGFTNGCFDLLHPGHLSLLRQAKATCDRLVVGLNSDASVSRLKGEDRPVQAESARALVLASLADVDAVVVFSEDTPLRLIESVRPDVLVKGADWNLDDVVGADFVQGLGGKIILAKLEPGFSTSATVAKFTAQGCD
ncbi:MAG: D-glycero-beta-D-manno-heptose-7-phosphate kinase [Hyphomicrobiales bacterium]|nr:D-glycero-beta-D-manno-heptose-7-phosphate kinase [Hyphomicrobiales bacterium]